MIYINANSHFLPVLNFTRSIPQCNALRPVPFEYCYAKTYTDKILQVSQFGYSVLGHSCIVGEVAKTLLSLMLPSLRSKLPQAAIWPAVIHDIGKVCPTFQKKIGNLHEALTDWSISSNIEKNWGGHAWVSSASLVHEYGSKQLTGQLDYIVGQHHGAYQSSPIYDALHESLGGAVWQSERSRLLHTLSSLFYQREDLPDFFLSPQDVSMRQFLSGMTIVADWIGSGPPFEKPSSEWRALINSAVMHAGFIPCDIKKGLSFEELFSFHPHPIQQSFYEQVKGPGLYVLEAPMGLGKTEAALYAAYRALESNQATGIYFALPTQLTSEKIHERLASFLQYACPQSEAMLLHSKAYLKAPLLHACDESGKIDQSWFATRKRALLAPFGVGTIDQALMAVINVRHASVRAFALAGKVVILDEVHSYDMYTGTLINELIRYLLEMDCTVIILSATLTRARREEFIPNNYRKDAMSQSIAYPLISSFKSGQSSYHEQACTTPPNLGKNVSLHFHEDEQDCILLALSEAARGAQILWIENTVGDAQQCYKKLKALALSHHIEMGLLHSRFTFGDRQAIEEYWINIYGKSGQERTSKGRILVGTQILEQSIDIDADILFTRFCPTDMLLQRLGRLQRHRHLPRPAGISCEAHILIPSKGKIQSLGAAAFGKSQFIYSPYVLLRSLEVWEGLSHISLPNSIRPVLEATYSDRQETDLMQVLQRELLVEAQKLKSHALYSLTESNKAATDDWAKTRLGEIEYKEILLVKRLHAANQELHITCLSGQEIAIPLGRKLSPLEQREFTVKLLNDTVKVPINYASKECLPLADALLAMINCIDAVMLCRDDTSLSPFVEKQLCYYTHHLGYENKPI